MIGAGAAAPIGVLVAYLLGSIPFGLLLSRGLAGIDVREGGSGNIGATNVARVAGPLLGVTTLVLDAVKGLVPVLVMRHLLLPFSGDSGAGALFGAGEWWVAAAGGAALLGHCFPVWLRFRGGKGVATSLGVLLGVAPFAAASGLVLFAVVFAATRVSSAGSLAGIASALPVAFVTGGIMPGSLTVFMGLVVLSRHHENIARLLRGSERRL